jgi:helix-turn-helix protein
VERLEYHGTPRAIAGQACRRLAEQLGARYLDGKSIRELCAQTRLQHRTHPRLLITAAASVRDRGGDGAKGSTSAISGGRQHLD